MKHRKALLDFSKEVLPYSGGSLAAFERSEYNTVQVGELFSSVIAPALFDLPTVFTSREPFTLVNVYCIPNSFSYGVCPPPPKEAQPSASTWFFTFAQTADRYYGTERKIVSKLRGISTRVWSTSTSGRLRYVTVAVPHNQATNLGLSYKATTAFFLYVMLGALTKSFVRSHRYWDEAEDFEASYRALHPALVHSGLYLQPAAQVISRLPYHLWVFNRSIWNFPSLICSKQVSEASAFYMAAYIPKEGLLSASSAVWDAFEKHVLNSLLNSIQLRDQGRPVEGTNLTFTALRWRYELPSRSLLPWLAKQEASYPSVLPATHFKKEITRLLLG